jgi:hypothetical protein
MNQPEKMLSYFDMKYKYTPVSSLHCNKFISLFETYEPPKNSYISGDSDSSKMDPLDQLMGQKGDLLRSKIEMILVGIEERKKIKQENLLGIDKDSCDCTNMLFQMPPYRKYGFDKERLTVEKMKKDLEKQKRMEEVNYFRDLALLQKDLKDTIIEYLSEQNKQSLISGLEE